MILKNSLSKLNYTVKNSWEFQKIIVTKTIPDGHVMISLDVVAMCNNSVQVLGREGCTGSCFSFLLAFRGGRFASPWMVIGDTTLFK